MKTYIFKYEIYDKNGNVVDKGEQAWQDKSQVTARNNLRVAMQEKHRFENGYWPRVELYCTNPDVGSYREDDRFL